MRLPALLLIALMPGLSSSAAGQSAQPQQATGRASEQRFVAIGCVTRQGTAASPRYVLTDSRGDRPTVYRLEADTAMLEQHVGHTLEVKGPIVGSAARNAQLTLRVNSIVWLASSCRK